MIRFKSDLVEPLRYGGEAFCAAEKSKKARKNKRAVLRVKHFCRIALFGGYIVDNFSFFW